jgi:hypothetical protein
MNRTSIEYQVGDQENIGSSPACVLVSPGVARQN